MKRWAPKYFPAELVRAAGRMLRNKLLFGSDYPLISPERWIKDFEALDVKPGVLPGILKENAIRVLGLLPSCRLQSPRMPFAGASPR